MSELQLTQAQQIDPGMSFAMQPNFAPEDIMQEVSQGGFRRAVSRGLLALGLSTGVFAGSSALFEGEVAFAEYECTSADNYVRTENYEDATGVLRTRYYCNDAPTTTTARPPTVTTAPTSGSSNPGGTVYTTVAAIPYADQHGDDDGLPNGQDNCDFIYNPDQSNLDSDADGDACDSDADGDGFSNIGELADINDMSPGLGDVGVQQLEDLGIDVDTGSEEAGKNLLIGLMVNPADWEQTVSDFAAYGISVLSPTTTTTTTEVPTTTIPVTTSLVETLTSLEEDPALDSAVTETIQSTITTVDPTTTEETLVSSADMDDSDEVAAVAPQGGGTSDAGVKEKLMSVGAGIVSVLGLGALILVARRRHNKHGGGSKASPTSFGGGTPSPVAGS